MQTRVRQQFDKLQKQDETTGQVPWFVIDAAQTIDEVQNDINTVVEKTMNEVSDGGKPIQVMWEDTTNKEN